MGAVALTLSVQSGSLDWARRCVLLGSPSTHSSWSVATMWILRCSELTRSSLSRSMAKLGTGMAKAADLWMIFTGTAFCATPAGRSSGSGSTNSAMTWMGALKQSETTGPSRFLRRNPITGNNL